jgi:hypothetical protein
MHRILITIPLLVLSAASPRAEPFQFFAFGDTRSNPDILELNIRSMDELNPSAIAAINGGDLTSEGTVSQWNDHHDALANGAPDSSVPADPSGIVRQSRFRTDVSDWGDYIWYIGAFGNHDDGATDWYQNWSDYLVGQKDLGVNSTNGIYFHLVYNNTLFILLDSVHPSSAQTAWLEQILQSPEGQDAKWKFAFFHHPVYPCNGKSPFDDGLEWVELFEQYEVDIAFVNHSHTYERTCPMIGGVCADGGVIYLNVSGGGAPVRDVEATKSDTVSHGGRSDSYDCADILVKYRSNWYHFCHVAIADCLLTIDCYSHDYYATHEAPYDTLEIDKCQVQPDGGPDGGSDGGDAGADDGEHSGGDDAGTDAGTDAGADPGSDQAADEKIVVIGSCGCSASNPGGSQVVLWLLLVAIGYFRRKCESARV